MGAYWRAVRQHLSTAVFDVLFVAVFSLVPLLVGRLAIHVRQQQPKESYWSFLTNGQLAFFAMGPLATILLFCFRKKLPDIATLWFGFFSVLCILFLVVLVGVDPTLQAGQAFVASVAIYLYLVVIVLRVIVDAMKAVGAGDALKAGASAAEQVQKGLEQRMRNDA